MRAFMLSLVLAMAAAAATGQEATGPEGPRIMVGGEGRVMRAPDMAELRLGVLAEAEEAEAATEALAERIAPVREALLAAEVAEADIQTSTVSLSPVYAGGYDRSSEPPQIAGYEAESILRVTVRDLGAIGRIIGETVAAGANRMDGIAFSLSDPRAAEEAALRQAVEDARRKAELIAEGVGQALGPVQSVTEQSRGAPRPMAMQMEARSAAASVPAAPGEIEVSASVRITYALGTP